MSLKTSATVSSLFLPCLAVSQRCWEKRNCQKEGALFWACSTYSSEGRMRCAAVLGRAAAALLGLLPPEVCAAWLWIKKGDGDNKKQGWGVKWRHFLHSVASVPRGRRLALAHVSRRWHRQPEPADSSPALPGPGQAGTAAPAGNSPANPGSQPP